MPDALTIIVWMLCVGIGVVAFITPIFVAMWVFAAVDEWRNGKYSERKRGR